MPNCLVLKLSSSLNLCIHSFTRAEEYTYSGLIKIYLLVLWAVDRINEIIQSLSIIITWHYFLLYWSWTKNIHFFAASPLGLSLSHLFPALYTLFLSQSLSLSSFCICLDKLMIHSIAFSLLLSRSLSNLSSHTNSFLIWLHSSLARARGFWKINRFS